MFFKEKKLQDIMNIIEDEVKKEKDSKDREKKSEIGKVNDMIFNKASSATQGNLVAREFLKNKIMNILQTLVTFKDIDILLKQYHIDYFKNIYSYDDECNLVDPIDKEIANYFEKYKVRQADSLEVKITKLSQIIYQELYGYGILDELIFDSVFNEIACNRFDYIWVQYKGIKRRIPNRDFRFKNTEDYKVIVKDRLTSMCLTDLTKGEARLEGNLECGHRVTAVRSPLSQYFVVRVRLHNMDKQVDKQKISPPEIEEFIKIMTRDGRRNVCVIGSQGCGKTTALNDLILKHLDKNISKLFCENVFELNQNINNPEDNAIELQYKNNIWNPRDLTELGFRLNADIMVYGEVREGLEAIEVIKAMTRQERGSMFTYHSNTVEGTIHRLRQLLMETSVYKSYKEAQFDIADAIDLIIQIKLNRKTGKRYIARVSECNATDDMGFTINDLFVYDAENEKYVVNKNGLTKQTEISCLDYEMTQKDLKRIRDIFSNKDNLEYFEVREDGVENV